MSCIFLCLLSSVDRIWLLFRDCCSVEHPTLQHSSFLPLFFHGQHHLEKQIPDPGFRYSCPNISRFEVLRLAPNLALKEPVGETVQQRRWLHTSLRTVRLLPAYLVAALSLVAYRGMGLQRETLRRMQEDLPGRCPPWRRSKCESTRCPAMHTPSVNFTWAGPQTLPPHRPRRLSSKSRRHLVPPRRRLGPESRLPKLQRSRPRRSCKTPRTLPRK